MGAYITGNEIIGLLQVGNVSVLPLPSVPKIFDIHANVLLYGNVNFTVSLPTPDDFVLNVFDIAGRMVWSYKQAGDGSGKYQINWNGSDIKGKALATGIYWVKLSSGKVDKHAKFFLLR
ncbi:hypothetical protein ES705_49450 [subsurface metagenome]